MKHLALINSSALLITLIATGSMAQEAGKKVNFTAGADFYSTYIFRGTRYGQGPSVQPSVKMTAGNLTLGVWGSFDFKTYAETDPYLSCTFPFGLSLGFTDYYYPGLDVFETSKENGSHALEINTGFSKGGFSLNANYILNEADGAGSKGGDIYIQAGYNFGSVNILTGVGNGWYTEDNNFNVCNIGIGTSKTIQVSDKFSIPVTGLVVLNPDRKQLFLIVGITL